MDIAKAAERVNEAYLKTEKAKELFLQRWIQFCLRAGADASRVKTMVTRVPFPGLDLDF